MRIPWLKIGSKPIVIAIEGLNVIVSLQQRDKWQVFDIFKRDYLESQLAAIIQKVENELTADDSQGYFAKLAIKVLDNIQIKIKDIHFRFEDYLPSIERSYSFGIVLKLLEV
jgi:vacuolar protein sorting-associated protein 13A/C